MKTMQLPEYVQKICNLMKSVSEVFPDDGPIYDCFLEAYLRVQGHHIYLPGHYFPRCGTMPFIFNMGI